MEDPTESDLGRVYSGSEFKGMVIMARQAQGQEEREAAGHMASTVKKTAMDAGARLTLLFTQTGLQHLDRSHPYSGRVFPSQLVNVKAPSLTCSEVCLPGVV